MVSHKTLPQILLYKLKCSDENILVTVEHKDKTLTLQKQC